MINLILPDENEKWICPKCNEEFEWSFSAFERGECKNCFYKFLKEMGILP